MNVAEETVEVYRDPDAAAQRYRVTDIHRPGQIVASQAIPGLTLEVAALFA